MIYLKEEEEEGNVVNGSETVVGSGTRSDFAGGTEIPSP